ncbi:hypothetical protein HDU76_013177 [Blyttiomyces sp. JEL0837]|nr:hypothetical protein HDU76_013177 [Blyttiomyces sp. JEL0837]
MLTEANPQTPEATNSQMLGETNSQTPPVTHSHTSGQYHILDSLPPRVAYFPQFITKQEEELLLRKVNTAPLPKWVTLRNRRLQNWGSTPIPTKNNAALHEDLPDWLETFAKKISETGLFTVNDKVIKPNHCLVNEYLPNQGIMPHEDGPAYEHAIATISLGQHCVLNFYKRKEGDESREGGMKPDFSLLVEPRSLLILTKDLYENYLHGIDEVLEDVVGPANIANWGVLNMKATNVEPTVMKRERARVSLTFRTVEKVIDTKKFMFKPARR